MPAGFGAGKPKLNIIRLRGYPGLPLKFLKVGHRGEYGKLAQPLKVAQ
jgi:hypothetical protein